MDVNDWALVTERLELRLAAEYDIPTIIQYYLDNQAFLAPYEPLRSKDFFTYEYWREQVRNRVSAFENDRALHLILINRADSQLIGCANFTNIIRGAFHACYLGYSLSERSQGQGYMTEALQVSLEFMFNERKMHRIMANYMPHNRRSGNLLKRLGFIVEGYARDYIYINGRWEDHILTSRINPNINSTVVYGPLRVDGGQGLA